MGEMMATKKKDWFPNEEEALSILEKEGTAPQVIEHCKTVARQAAVFSEKASSKGMVVDRELVTIGALLHDIGRSKTHEPSHGFVGGKLLRDIGVDERIVKIAERHVGAGIPADEAKTLGLPERDFIPETIEEKIVCYADKVAFGTRIGTAREVVAQLEEQLGAAHPAIERLKRFCAEMEKRLLNDNKVGGKE